jgi:hypothetical protein
MNQTTERGGENEGIVNDASVGMGEVNHRQAEEAGIGIPEEPGRSKRKRVQRQLADALNGCLCGLVLDSSSEKVLKCKQAGCETLWVSTLFSGSHYIHSIISNA